MQIEIVADSQTVLLITMILRATTFWGYTTTFIKLLITNLLTSLIKLCIIITSEVVYNVY